MGSHRLGKFFIPRELIQGQHEETLYSLFCSLKFIPLRVECLGYNDMFEYIGISPMFKKVAIGGVALQYDIEIEFNDHEDPGDIGVKVKRK